MATFVLVHPAWLGGWCWKKVTPLLRARGHDVYTPTLTGLGERAHLARPDVGLETHIEDVVRVLRYEDLSGVIPGDLADMEGPTVKRFVTAPSISSSMMRSGHFSGGHERFPEDADARLTMERLRRRIRLICAGCSEEQSRMTPLRRELPPSRGASRPGRKTGRRIASARTLQSCSHRAVADVARESRSHYPGPLASVTLVTRRRAGSRVASWRPR